MKKIDGTKNTLTLPVILLDELRSEDPKKRLNSLLHIKVIGTALGPERTRNQLLPFLNEFVDDTEDIVLAVMVALRELTPLMGGDSYEKLLIPILINLAKSDEKNVAQNAIEYIKSIVKRIGIKNCEELAWDILKKLVESDSINAKNSGISLLVVMVKELSASQLLDLYYLSATDPTCQIRKIAARHLKELVLSLKESHAMASQIVSTLLNDRQDLIKMMALEGGLNYFTHNPVIVLDALKNILQANSWRTNLKICELMPLILKNVSALQFKTFIQKPYLAFLLNEEPQLRAAAVSSLEKVCAYMEQTDIVNLLVPVIKKLSKDTKTFVRVQVAKYFLSIVKYIPKNSLTDTFLPMLSDFLKDPDAEISLSVFSSLSHLTDTVSAVQLQQHTLTCVNQLFASNKWRTKCHAIDIMSQLVKNSSFVNDRMLSMIVSWAYDKIDAVRIKAIGLIEEIFKIYGGSWAESKLIPKVTSLQNNPNYLQRQLILQIIERVCKYCSQEIFQNYFYPTICLMAKDKVPNIRCLVVKIFKSNPNLLNNVKYHVIIEILSEDKDPEIKNQAKAILI